MTIVTEQVKESFQKLSENPSSFDERDRLVLSFMVYNIPSSIQDDILDAYDYYQLNPSQYDGTTGAKENWVTKYEPSSMRHDLDYQTYGGTYKGRLYADLKFLDYKTRYEASSIWRNLQYYAVRWGGFVFQFKNWLKGNVTEVPLDKVFLAPLKRTNKQLIIEWVGIITVIPILICVVGAIAMDIKHQLSIGWKLSSRWLVKYTKNIWRKVF